MFRRTPSKWRTLDDFDPTTVGFKYDETISVHSLISQLLQQFQTTMPPGRMQDFVAAILMDGISFWQLAEEFRLKPQFELEFNELKYEGTLYGIPLVLFGIEGIALATRLCLAPAVLRQQLSWNEKELEEMRAEQVRFAQADVPPDTEPVDLPKKEDMH